MKVNVGKTKVVFERGESKTECNNVIECGKVEQVKEEGLVLQRVGECAILAGAPGSASAVEAARKLAVLRHAPAAELLARVASHATHADRPTRRELYGAAVTHCTPDCIQDILRARLHLEQEDLQQEIGEKTMIMRELHPLTQFHERYESTDDEFSDAITTPDIEKKDIIAPPSTEKKIPLFNYLLDTWQTKFSLSSGDKTVLSSDPVIDRSVHCQEFYHNLYPEFKVSSAYYRYDRFSLPDSMIEGQINIGQMMLKSFYIQNCLENHSSAHLEGEVMQKCADELMYKDTSLSIACLLKSLLNQKKFKKYVAAQNTELSVSIALYTLLMKCNALVLKDDVFLTKPVQMAHSTVTDEYTMKEHLELIKLCLDKLTTMVEYSKLKSLGYSVNGSLFNGDEDYRKEIIYRMARSRNKQHVDLACSLATKHGLDATSVWVQHATAVICGSGGAATGEILKELSSEAMLQAFKADKETSINCIKEELWDSLSGNDHNALIYYFTLLKNVDDKLSFGGLAAVEHIKLLKKTKAASQELDYKLLLSQPSTDELYGHLLQIMKPENLGILMKLLRNLPPSLKIPVSVNTLYTMWLTKYFFSVSPSNATSKKWMQQYRQCVSYFNKLSRDDLKVFIKNTCFSPEAVERVPSGTRNLMIMQAVDYCQQEQENEAKYNKNDNTWSEMGQELTQWARFLESFHSPTIESIIISSKISKDEIWPEIEMSHGDIEAIRNPLGRLVMEAEIKPTVLATLLQNLHLNIEIDDLFLHILDHYVDSLERMQILVNRLSNQHKDNARLSEQLLERVLAAADRLGLPPHKQIVLLSLSQPVTHLIVIPTPHPFLNPVPFSVAVPVQLAIQLRYQILFSSRSQFSALPRFRYKSQFRLRDDMLLKEEGRQEIFLKFLNMSDTWQRKKALVDVLNCWPVTKNASDGCSLQFEYIKWLLNDKNQSETLALLKLLLRKPVLTDQEIKLLIEHAQPEATINIIWMILLSKSEKLKNEIPKLIQNNKEIFQGTSIEDDLIKELLDKGLFLKLVSSDLYPHIVNYVAIGNSLEQAHNYSMKWMISELFKANFTAEAGQLQLTMLGVPNTLKGFSQSVLYCRNVYTKNKE
ncbi:Neuroblastoma-amplified sequence [Eumeta japonica]|uniref:Neuroblastoma-amplified sequence n=1 Tax=Eumeta variegata TaxID=151549 RepID=A0A4C1W0I6_EUMVA|nr:Neuroblastoma-amplified sequence [Eumeta japonica]